MKKLYKAVIAFLCVAMFACIGCGKNKGKSPSTPSVTVHISDSALTMDCLDGYTLTASASDGSDVSWSSSDTSVVSVEGGALTSFAKTGVATVTAASGNATATYVVTVTTRSGLPSFSVANSLVIAKGKDFSVTANVYYRGEDVSEHVTFGCNAAGNVAAVTAQQTGNRIVFTGVDVGSADYTVYANAFGGLYADTVHIEVKDTTVSYSVRQGNGKLLLQRGRTASTADVEVRDDGVLVPDSTLRWSVQDETIVTLPSIGYGVLSAGQEGTTSVSATYKGVSIIVPVRVVKEHIPVVLQERADVDLALTINPSVANTTRTYTVPQGRTVSLNGFSGDTVRGAALDGNVLDENKFSVNGNALSVQTEVFGTDAYGEKTLNIQTETADSVFDITCPVLLITKQIGTKAELEAAVSEKVSYETIFGYFTLKQDVDFAGYASSALYMPGWDYAYGFRGTLDGRGHKIMRLKTAQYGLSAHIGNGAVLKNIEFTDVQHTGGLSGSLSLSLFGRGIGAATMQDITITLSSDSTPDVAAGDGGLFAYAIGGAATFTNVTLHAEGKTINNLFGKENVSSCRFTNVHVYASAVVNWSHNRTDKPNGITLHS